MRTTEATKEASRSYFDANIIVITAEGIAACSNIMSFVNPSMENRLIITNATENPPRILNTDARQAIFAASTFISVSL
jgi:hypothetical protein